MPPRKKAAPEKAKVDENVASPVKTSRARKKARADAPATEAASAVDGNAKEPAVRKRRGPYKKKMKVSEQTSHHTQTFLYLSSRTNINPKQKSLIVTLRLPKYKRNLKLFAIWEKALADTGDIDMEWRQWQVTYRIGDIDKNHTAPENYSTSTQLFGPMGLPPPPFQHAHTPAGHSDHRPHQGPVADLRASSEPPAAIPDWTTIRPHPYGAHRTAQGEVTSLVDFGSSANIISSANHDSSTNTCTSDDAAESVRALIPTKRPFPYDIPESSERGQYCRDSPVQFRPSMSIIDPPTRTILGQAAASIPVHTPVPTNASAEAQTSAPFNVSTPSSHELLPMDAVRSGRRMLPSDEGVQAIIDSSRYSRTSRNIQDQPAASVSFSSTGSLRASGRSRASVPINGGAHVARLATGSVCLASFDTGPISSSVPVWRAQFPSSEPLLAGGPLPASESAPASQPPIFDFTTFGEPSLPTRLQLTRGIREPPHPGWASLSAGSELIRHQTLMEMVDIHVQGLKIMNRPNELSRFSHFRGFASTSDEDRSTLLERCTLYLKEKVRIKIHFKAYQYN